MTEKDLLKKLHSYTKMEADKAWKEKNRAVLLGQIHNSSSQDDVRALWASFARSCRIYSDTFYNGIVKKMGQPVILTSMIVLMVLGGGIVSISASYDSTPGDSLYIAKKISEKTKFAFTFDEKKKAQLSVSFAEERAREIAQVMNEEKDETEKKEIVDKLNNDIKDEINNVKVRIEKIAQEHDAAKNSSDSEESEKTDTEESEDQIFTANLGKGDDGLSLENGDNDKSVELFEDGAENTEKQEDGQEGEKEATSSTESLEELGAEEQASLAASSSEIIDSILEKTDGIEKKSSEMLSEVKELIENGDFDGSLEKLNDISENLEKEAEEGEVKGVSEKNIEEGSESAEESEEENSDSPQKEEEKESATSTEE